MAMAGSSNGKLVFWCRQSDDAQDFSPLPALTDSTPECVTFPIACRQKLTATVQEFFQKSQFKSDKMNRVRHEGSDGRHKNGFIGGMGSIQDKNGANNGGNTIGKMPIGELSKKWARQCSLCKILWGAGFVLAILSLIAVGVVSHRAGNQLQQATQSVAHTRAVLEKLGSIAAQLSEVESAARSFAISGKQSHLSPFYTAAEGVPPQIGDLKLLLQDEPGQFQSVVEIEPVIARHLKVMKDMVELGDKNLFRGFGQRNLTDEGNGLMEQIRAAFRAMDDEQHTLLNQEQATLAEKTERITMVSVAGSVLAGVLVLASGACALRALQGRAKVKEKLDQLLGSLPDALVIVNAEGKIVGSNAHAGKLFGYSDRELQGESMALLVPERFRKSQRQYYATCFSQRGGQIPEMTMELCGLHKDGREFPIEVRTNQLAAEKGLVVTSAIRDITERKQVALQISKLNKELELRAIELENANKEWEAFSYSVSHDLRSPLQNIERFSLILMEDYASQLDQEGLDYVQRLRGSCQHMEDIIDALLALSNMMRKELLVDHFDFTALANAVAADLKQKAPDRLVDWVVAEGLTAEGDAQLLRVVLENLFGNAWKFTANRPRARIEFGALPQVNGARTYFVRDDGAGFDMAHASNLFTPFKRLHEQSEFRGTGIGLATVHRVINRHQGKIWAEGIVNQGATFCFTLADETGESNEQNHYAAKPR
jgi:PAS domain S-box-containing protein